MTSYTSRMADGDNKVRITITIDPKLLERLDAVCEATNIKRSSIIERMIEEKIVEREKLVRDMENPVLRAIARGLASSPNVVEAVAKLVGEKFTDEDRKWIREGLREQIELGKQRAEAKKAARSAPGSTTEGAEG